MIFFSFYRFYVSFLVGLLVYFLFLPSILFALLSTVLARLVWVIIESIFMRISINRNFKLHISAFRAEYGPYGIRIANKAEKKFEVKQSLCEVFSKNISDVKTTVDQLELMNVIFNAGMRPKEDDFLLHDLKLKYGKLRIEKNAIGS